jgi:hypothetical protein
MAFLQCLCDIPYGRSYRRLTSLYNIPSFLPYVSITYSTFRTYIRLKSVPSSFDHVDFVVSDVLFDQVDFVVSNERCVSDVLNAVSHGLLVQFAPFFFYWPCYIPNSMSGQYQAFIQCIEYTPLYVDCRIVVGDVIGLFPSTFSATIRSLNLRISTTIRGILVILLAIVF